VLAARARYGPFWIATTLVFLSAVAGNYASYVSYRRTHAAAASGSDVPAWYYDVDKARARGRRPASPQPQPGSMSWEQAGAPRDAQAMRASSTGRPGPARRAAHEQGDCRQRQSAARPRPAARTGQGLSRVYPAPGAQVGYSAILFYGYVGVVGLALFAALKWWFKAEVGLAQVWCTYGARPPGGARLHRARFDLAQNACGSAISICLSVLLRPCCGGGRGLPGLHALGARGRAGTCSKHPHGRGRLAQALCSGRRLCAEHLHPRVVRVRAAV